MDKWVGKVALVTGASSGIGNVTARRLAEYGMKVVGCARDIRKIQSTAENPKDCKGSLTAIQCDVSKEDQIVSMFEKIKKDYGGVDVCVNNAGMAHNAPLLTGSTEQWKNMFDVNVLGLMICTRESIKSMQERGVDDGVIVLISSMTGHRVFNNPVTHVYSSTKHLVRAITEGLRNELNAIWSHFRVTAITPGVVETEFVPRKFPGNPEAVKQLYILTGSIQPDDIADAVIYSMTAPLRTQIE